MTCIVLGGLSGLIAAVYLAVPYVTGRIPSGSFLMTSLLNTATFGLLIYPFWSAYRRALRQEAERAERAANSTGD
ncbi:hypothetical protein [Actinopolyspora mzabensis]|uniref:hypothetical protein n=1 Tax=Actinopolyspora mzabensis TaxID=995066 RepID=UPI00115F80A2|nr:hypothetical protein [Actinopolyspora mzabensis]